MAIALHEESTKNKVQLYSFGNVNGLQNILTMLESTSENLAPEPVVVQNPKTETCIIFWSSGTTGMPKGICHRQKIAAVISILIMGLTPSLSDK